LFSMALPHAQHPKIDGIKLGRPSLKGVTEITSFPFSVPGLCDFHHKLECLTAQPLRVA
jgi:hypothetical protein